MTKKKRVPDPKEAAADTPTTGVKIRKGAGFSMGKASKDAPIFYLGFVVGGRFSRFSPKKPEEQS